MAKVIWPCPLVASALAWAMPSLAGPPFLTDDPFPTDYRHYEIYLFGNGTFTADGTSGDAGIDFNYGAVPDLQLTAVVPVSYEHPDSGNLSGSFGNVELAAKYRFLYQQSSGWDMAVFPRAYLPGNSRLADQHASLLIPVWIGRDTGDWSSYGGGGCVLNPGGDSKDYCLAGWALVRCIGETLQLGAELYHQSADTKGGSSSTVFGLGATHDVNANIHLLGYANAGLQNTAETGHATWYASILFTF